MAKRDTDKNGKYVPRRNKILQINLSCYEIENRKKPKQRPGIRLQVINAYKSRKNKEDAYKIAEIHNEKIGKDVYTKEMIDEWIEVYKNTTIKQKEDDDAR